MTVKDLIIKLLEESMKTEVQLTIDDPHQDEHGDCSGYVFDIDSVSHEFGMCMIKFTDWREKKKILDEAIDGPGKGGKTINRCKFRSQKNCDFCAFHSECDEHWKEGDSNDTDG